MRTFSISTISVILILISFAIVTSFFTFGSLAMWRFSKRQKRVASEAVHKYEALNKELREIRKSYSDFVSILGADMAKSDDESGKGGPEMLDSVYVPVTDPSSADEITLEAAMDLSSALMESASLKSNLEELTEFVDAKITELATTPSIWPVKVEPGEEPKVSSKFGWRRNPFRKNRWEMHRGIDIPSSRGTPLIATADGTIAETGRDKYLGKFVEICHNEKFSTMYGHMDRFAENIEAGTEVKRGDVIGYMGTTGRSTGCHVHYEVRVYGKRVDPVEYILN
jgi:murein DD-endopeptidase MepM/ murein hydrolase activator NlpD